MGERAVPLDPQLQAMRDQRERDNVPPLYTMSLAEARAADLASIRQSGGEPEPVHEVVDLTIDGPGGELPVRLYRCSVERPAPTLLYFFGGGWTLGNIDTSDFKLSFILQRFTDVDFNRCSKFGIALQEFTSILFALSKFDQTEAVKRSTLFDHTSGHTKIDQLAHLRDAFVVDDVKLSRSEWGSDLVLYNLDPRTIAKDLLAIL